MDLYCSFCKMKKATQELKYSEKGRHQQLQNITKTTDYIHINQTSI